MEHFPKYFDSRCEGRTRTNIRCCMFLAFPPNRAMGASVSSSPGLGSCFGSQVYPKGDAKAIFAYLGDQFFPVFNDPLLRMVEGKQESAQRSSAEIIVWIFMRLQTLGSPQDC
ncbi:hypothetical protein AVEN_72240-1 [Araneus ventricosus]|uniref:Uncharacterized protein n=1 Tax=Araneus ventricosus TaxID=182803 RepID=A0A4Y2GTV0_ARAVE|nr:hypothetical protein AVEN_72240-1 [Araneus ventricosus]